MPSRIIYATDFLLYYNDGTGDDIMARNAMVVQYDTLEELRIAHANGRAEEKLVIKPRPARQETGAPVGAISRVFQAIAAYTSRPRQRAQD